MNARSRVRHRATRSAASRTSALVALGLAGILGIGLGLPATGSYALWNSATAVSAGSIQAGSLTAAASVSPTLAVTYATAATLRSGSDATLARNVTVVVWKTASVATCGSPASAVTGTWTAFPAL